MLRGFQWDLARQVERLDWLLAQLPRYADWGYNELYLHLEDAVEFPSLPGVARRDAFSYRQFGRLVAAAEKVGIKTVPIVNLLGHTQYLIKVPALRDLNELRAADGSPLPAGQICPVHPRTPEIARRLINDIAPFCSAGKVHVGLDESFHLGKHPRSRKEIEKVGLAAHFARYVSRLNGIARESQLRLGMWADMLYFIPEAVPLLPTDITAYEWYYYGFRRRPRVELFNFRESKVGEQLVARGIEYWGCPMNGAFRYEPLPHFSDRLENVLSWWRRCHRLNAAGMLMTSWEPYRLAIELTTVVDAAAASLWLDAVDEPRAMLERGFARVFGKRRSGGGGRPPGGPYVETYSPAERKRARAAAGAAFACDRYPFSGYPRWEINARWDTVSRREPITRYRAEERWFRRLMTSTRTPLPAPLQMSIELRWYLAFRDVWVREAARGTVPDIRAFRAAAKIGLAAARKMWAFTRDRAIASPNEQIIRDDLQRAVGGARDFTAVFGPRWQLCYCATNIEPAVTLVGVESRDADEGDWEVRQACHTIEFQSLAARPRGSVSREHAAPIPWSEAGPPRYVRLFARGPGRVRISDLVLTDGKRVLYAPDIALGTAAPLRGLPAGALAAVDRHELEFRRKATR